MYNNVYEIAQKYQDLISQVPYPSSTSKPRREHFSSNKDFGIAMDEYEQSYTQYKSLKHEYIESVRRLEKAFRRDLLVFLLGNEDHPKAETLFHLAWEHGHSSGLNDVASYAEDFAELLR